MCTFMKTLRSREQFLPLEWEEPIKASPDELPSPEIAT